MIRVLRFLMFAFLVFVAGTIAAFVLLPWWQALIVVLAIIVATVWGTQYLIGSVWRQIGKTVSREVEKRSMALRGAEAEVHSVVVAEAPPKEADEDEDWDGDEDEAEEQDEDEGPRTYYQIDVTIKPPAAPPEGATQEWQTTELHLVPSHASKPVFDLLRGSGTIAEQGCEPLNVQVERNGTYEPDDDGEYEGPRRLRMLFALPADWKEVKFQYYGEQFGNIPLPPAVVAPPPPPMLGN